MPSISNFPSSQVRKIFLDYFGHRSSSIILNSTSKIISQHEHTIVPSIPLLPPLNDPSLTFVNAGMNAWKNHLLGSSNTTVLPSSKVANTQKCVRISDVDVVGYDGYHHTFFEMLGSWSFNGAYTRTDACRMAWEFLTGPMALEKEKLYVTYFNGSSNHEADYETKEIWKNLGIKDSHVLGFGHENFWEMGSSGPCGPCTEIHYDHKGRGASGVNQGFDDLVELWNIVFMEEERIIDGTLTSLQSKHIDTGMGLERLCAIKNKTTSNFDTDLFLPLFEEISQHTNAPKYKGKFKPEKLNRKSLISNTFGCKDTAYRIVGDHTRMIAACLSDGFLPDTNHRLKSVLRRTLQVIENNFISTGGKYSRTELLTNLCKVNSDILGEHYPELHENFDRVKLAIEYENEILTKREMTGLKEWKKIATEHPSLADMINPTDASQFQEALKILNSIDLVDGKINGDTAYKLYDTAGLNEDDIEILAKHKHLEFHREEFKQSFATAKSKSKLMSALQQSKDYTENRKHTKPTDDQYKYMYQKEHESHYTFPMIKSKLLDIVNTAHLMKENKDTSTSEESNMSKKKRKGDRCGIILDKTTFYSEAGGQVGDKGTLVGPNGSTFVVEDCQKVDGSHEVMHLGYVRKGFFHPGIEVKCQIDTDRRIACMQNHTATHLLNYVLHSILPLTYQYSSRVNGDWLKFDFSTYNVDFNNEVIADIEIKVNSLIGRKTDISRDTINVQDAKTFMSTVSNGSVEITNTSVDSQHPWYTVEDDEETKTSAQNNHDIPEIESSQCTQIAEEGPFGTKSKFISIPGQQYPDEIHVITVPGGGVEPCCGTHVKNVGDVQAFVILDCKSAGKGSIKSMKCVSGNKALEARTNGINLLADIAEITDEIEEMDECKNDPILSGNVLNQKSVDDSNAIPEISKHNDISKRIKDIKTALKMEDSLVPYTVRIEIDDILKELSQHLRKSDRASSKSNMESELEEVLEDYTHLNSIVHLFTTKTPDVKLGKFDQMCNEKPMLLILQEKDNVFSARACVPKNYLHKCEEGLASKWLESASKIFIEDSTLLHKSIKYPVVKEAGGKNPKQSAYMSRVKLSSTDKETNMNIINSIILSANEFSNNTWP